MLGLAVVAEFAVAIAAMNPGSLTPFDPAAVASSSERSVFEPNLGQAGLESVFVSRMGRGRMAVRRDGLAFEVQEAGERRLAWSLSFVGASSKSEVAGEESSSTKLNYVFGADPSCWLTHVGTWRSVRYRNLYERIDAVTFWTEAGLRTDFIVRPGANPSQILVRFTGTCEARLEASGTAKIETEFGQVTFGAPRVHQERGGGVVPIRARYVPVDRETLGIDLDDYDASQPLVVDPTLDFSSYLGGSSTEQASFLGEDGAGGLVVVGTTYSSDFPTTNPFQPTFRGGHDAFVTKIDLNTKSVIYSTFLGGDAPGLGTWGWGVAVDPTGGAYVAGETDSDSFPVLASLQATRGGGTDAFITYLDSGGAPMFSTYLGGSGHDAARAVALDADGSVYIAGFSESSNYPLRNPYQLQLLGASDAVVTKLTADGSSLLYSTYVGGSGPEAALAIAVDSSGNAVVAGYTGSPDLPLVRPVQDLLAGGDDELIAELDATGSNLLFSTYLGGSLEESASSVAIDPLGRILVAGKTVSSDFPTAAAAQASNAGGTDGVVSRIDLSSSSPSLVFSTYLGGTGSDSAASVLADPRGGIIVTGKTYSADFPLAGAISGPFQGVADASVSRYDDNGLLLDSFLVGGSDFDEGVSAAVDATGELAVVGSMKSVDAPVKGAFQAVNAGGSDAFVFTMNLPACTPDLTAANLMAVKVDASTMDLSWANVSTASDYVVRQDMSKSGTFGTISGRASSGSPGLVLGMPSPPLAYFRVAGENGCGEGPR